MPKTGIPILDLIVEAIERRDAAELVRHVDFQLQPCVAEPKGLGGGPDCPAGVTDGTLTKAVAGGRCEGGRIREDQALQDLTAILGAQPSIFAIARWQTRPGSLPFATAYTVILSDSPLIKAAPYLQVSEQGIWSINGGCFQTAAAAAAIHSDFVLPPSN